jgi:hypothetical protein
MRHNVLAIIIQFTIRSLRKFKGEEPIQGSIGGFSEEG